MNKSTATNLLQKSTALSKLFLRVMDNPIILKELRGRMRGRRAFIVLICYLVGVSLLIAVVYNQLKPQMSYYQPQFRQTAGLTIFGSVLGFELLMIGFIGPALTAGSITAEREHQTLDLLRTTLISPRTLILGKLGSACSYMLLLVLTPLPIQALAFLIGGIGPEEILISFSILLANIAFFCALGILCSSISQRTLTATIACYSIILVGLLISGLILYGFIQAMNSYTSSGSYSSPGYMLTSIGLWMFCSTNSLLAALTSEGFLMTNHTLYYGIVPFGTNIYLFSPWVLHVGLFVILAAILILISILRVHNTER